MVTFGTAGGRVGTATGSDLALTGVDLVTGTGETVVGTLVSMCDGLRLLRLLRLRERSLCEVLLPAVLLPGFPPRLTILPRTPTISAAS